MHTITRLEVLNREFQRIRAVGYSTDREETTESACCLASPILDYAGAVIGAIGITMSAKRFPTCRETQFASQVRKSAATLSRELGYSRGVGHN
ncbi:MAG: IclR family transcriptional regulator domain-containing protein [Bryobacteraceae bacterium]